MDLVLLVICVAISSADRWEAIEQFGNEKFQWLRRFVALPMACPRMIVLPR